jgi:hypothetical protein
MKEEGQMMAQFISKQKVSLGESGANNEGPTMCIEIPYD